MPDTGDVDPESAAHTIALRLLDVRPRTRHELEVALSRRHVPEAAALSVLDRLEDVGLIDDAAFANAWVDSRHTGRGLGRRALGAELRRKGIDPVLSEVALAAVSSDDEASVARNLVDRKLRAMSRLDATTKIRRLSGMLARKGIGGGIAHAVIRDALEAERASDNGHVAR